MIEVDSDDLFKALDEAYDSEENESENKEANVSSQKHKRLLHDISTIAGVPVKRVALRSEPSKQVDEHLWSQQKDEKGKLQLNDLLESVPKTSSIGSLKKKIEKIENQAVLDTPLSKPRKEKIERTIAYNENAKEVSKWAPTVIKNRTAENLSFPLNQFKAQELTTKSAAIGFKPRTSLEKEIAAVLKGSASVLERKNKELTESEEKALQAVDLQEAIARRHELQKLRALQSYYELKCKRQKKIKSKKFRKILRKSEQKKEAKNETSLTEEQKCELSNETERNRALERAHLRHRNTSKWAKKLANKTNRSKEETQLLHDQLKVSRQLTEQKVYELDTDDDVDDEHVKVGSNEGFTLLKASSDNEDNPWLLGKESQTAKDTKGATSKYIKDDGDSSSDDSEEENEDEKGEDAKKSDDEWIEAGKIVENSSSKSSRKSRSKKANRAKPTKGQNGLENKDESDLDSEIEYEHVIDIACESNEPNAQQQVDITDVTTDLNHTGGTSFQGRANAVSGKDGHGNQDDFLSVESKALDVDLLITDNSDIDLSKTKRQKSLIREAFANDAVLEDFAEEKKLQNEKRMPKDEDLTLPGWGDWGGACIDNEAKLERKRKKFVKKATKQRLAKDTYLKHVIINQEKNSRFAANQVTTVPFPFSSESQFEKSVRQPLGKTWNTPSMTAKLTQPRISTLIGTIIDPIKKTKEISKVATDERNKTKKFISNKRKSRK